MKAKTVNENIRFERDQDPKQAMGVGEDRFKQEGDIEFGDKFYYRNPDNDSAAVIVNAKNGNQHRVGLYAARDVKEALIALL